MNSSVVDLFRPPGVRLFILFIATALLFNILPQLVGDRFPYSIFISAMFFFLLSPPIFFDLMPDFFNDKYVVNLSLFLFFTLFASYGGFRATYGFGDTSILIVGIIGTASSVVFPSICHIVKFGRYRIFR
jgi:hypothetical protein